MKMLLVPITQALNAYLQLDSESSRRLQKLHGKAITIELLPFHFSFQCCFTEQGVNLATENLQISETVIRGTPLQMFGMMAAKDQRQRFFAEDLIIEGNAELGQQVVELFDELQIDWEDRAAKIIGDVPAYHASRFMKNMRQWLRQTDETVTQDVNDYIHEEAEWLPTHEALQDFFQDIDTLRMDVDRADAKIEHLNAACMTEINQEDEERR